MEPAEEENEAVEVVQSNEIEKKKILSILTSNLELQGDIFNARLYSAEKDGVNWLFSGIEGILCIIMDFQAKTKYIVIYDPANYEKVFQYELYSNFVKYFESLAPDFRSLEIEGGFLGLQFDSEADAEQFERSLKRVAGFGNDMFSKPRSKGEDKKYISEKVQLYCKTLKKNFCTDEKYDENYAEDGTQILKHRNFKVLNNINYDTETKQFKFGKISEELKEMFLSFGIKKKDLERDADFAFTLFKKVIVGLGSENKLKNSVLDRLEHSFPPPEEREKQRRQEALAEAKINKLNKQRTMVKRTAAPKAKQVNKKVNNSKAGGKSGSAVPPPPPPPPPMVTIKKVVVNSEETKPDNSNNTTVNAPAEEFSMEKELQKIKLKKVVKEEKTDKNIQGNGKNFLQNALSEAIKNRRMALTEHETNDDDDNDDDDDWD